MNSNRHFYVDWLRVIAVFLLILYHTAIVFQPWGTMIGFITNEEKWTGLWLPMQMLNIWRIPLLFFVSGMGVCFSIQTKNWKEFITERTLRILLPFLFGYFVLVPFQSLIWLNIYKIPFVYLPNSGHLWFLGNLFVYVLLFSFQFIYLKNNFKSKLAITLKKILSNPISILLVMFCFVIEALIVKPFPFEMYATTLHGFVLGMLAFLFGFCFAYTGDNFFLMIRKWKWLTLFLAFGLYTSRILQNLNSAPNYLLAIESAFWIITILAFTNQYLNRSSNFLNYMNKAVYPIYMIHIIVLFAISKILLPLQMNVQLKFILLLLFTGFGSWLLYEFIIKRIKLIRPLFGLKQSSI